MYAAVQQLFSVVSLSWPHPLPSSPWWRHQMEIFSALLAICAGNSPVTGEFPTQRPVTRSFDVYFDLRPNEWLSKQSWGWWFETLSRSLWRHRNATPTYTLFVTVECVAYTQRSWSWGYIRHKTRSHFFLCRYGYIFRWFIIFMHPIYAGLFH